MSRMVLEKVGTTKSEGAQRVLVYGAEKSGKTTFICSAPKVIAINIEDRMRHIDVPAFPLVTSWREVMEALAILRKEDHPYQNVAIDSVTVLERHIKEEVMRVAGWNEIEAEEYGRWLAQANSTYWPRFFASCEALQRERGMGILMTAQLQTRKIQNPSGDDYDRYRPQLGGTKGPDLFNHWVDHLGFVRFEDIVHTQRKGRSEKTVTGTTGKRVIYWNHHPAYDAGNSANLPDMMPLDYATFDRVRAQGYASIEALIASGLASCEEVKDEKIRKAAVAFFKKQKTEKNATAVRSALNRLAVIIDDQEQETKDDA